jgi:hypothetical protein
LSTEAAGGGEARPTATVTPFVPRRRAFDLVEHLAPRLAQEQTGCGHQVPPLSEYEMQAAETLMAIAQAMAPGVAEMRVIARQHGIAGADAGLDFLADPRLPDLILERFPCDVPDPELCRLYFEAHADAFRTADLYDGREILIGGDVTDHAWRSEAYGRAERLVAMLVYDRRMFKDLLIYSAAPSRAREGRVGPVALGAWQSEVATPFFSLRPGEIFPMPVPSSQGFHILMMDAITPGRRRSFTEAHADVVRRLTQRARLAAAARHLAQLRHEQAAH